MFVVVPNICTYAHKYLAIFLALYAQRSLVGGQLKFWGAGVEKNDWNCQTIFGQYFKLGA